jgi:ribonucleoside-diphosphate reductase alpha chain
MWGMKDEELSGRWDWASLRKEVMEHGVRNLISCLPTDSQILGNNEAFEPYIQYIHDVYCRESLSCKKHLLNDLVELGLWNETLTEMRNNGSVQD